MARVQYIDFWPKIYLILYPSFGNLRTQIAIFFSTDLLLLYLIDGSEKKPRSNFLVVFPSGPINFVAFILFFVSCWILWFEFYTGDFFQEHKMKDEIAIQTKRTGIPRFPGFRFPRFWIYHGL